MEDISEISNWWPVASSFYSTRTKICSSSLSFHITQILITQLKSLLNVFINNIGCGGQLNVYFQQIQKTTSIKIRLWTWTFVHMFFGTSRTSFNWWCCSSLLRKPRLHYGPTIVCRTPFLVHKSYFLSYPGLRWDLAVASVFAHLPITPAQ